MVETRKLSQTLNFLEKGKFDDNDVWGDVEDVSQVSSKSLATDLSRQNERRGIEKRSCKL